MENTEQSRVEKFDCQGFFADKDFWSEEAVEALAKANDIGDSRLSTDHWTVINFVKEYYEVNGRGPAIIKVVKQTGFSLKQICELFPCGLVKGAYRLAGLPRPPGCV